MSPRKLLPIVLVVILAAVLANTALRRTGLNLVVVNPSAAAVKISVNGASHEVPASGRLLVEGLPRDLKLSAGGVPVDAGGASASATTVVWSVAPVGTWWSVSKGYGDLVGTAPASTAFVPSSSPVFALPEDHALVDEPLPENAAVKKGVTGTLLRGLWTDGFAERTAPRRVMLVVHNDAGFPMRIEINGATAAKLLPPEAVMHVPDQPAGPMKLRAVILDKAGKDAQDYPLEVELTAGAPLAPPAVHVWDVGGKSRFWVASRRYGPNPDADGPPPPPAPFEVPAGQSSTFFTLPAGFFHEVDAEYPDTWGRQEVLKFLWCEDFVHKQRNKVIPPEIQSKLDALVKAGPGGEGTKPPETTTATPPQTSTEGPQSFPPVPEDERKGE